MSMRSGELDTRIALQRSTRTVSAGGDVIETWSNLAERWSAVRPLSGNEVNGADQWVAREQTEFTIRWSSDVADFAPLDRVVCPASDAGSSPDVVRSIYDVISVHEIGRNEGMRIVAARRV